MKVSSEELLELLLEQFLPHGCSSERIPGIIFEHIPGKINSFEEALEGVPDANSGRIPAEISQRIASETPTGIVRGIVE